MNTAAQKKDRPSRAQRRRASAAAKGRSTAPTDTVWFVAIFALAFLLRVIYLFQIESIPLFYNLAGDGRTYDEWAQRIAGGDWLGEGVFYQAPLYPYFLGLLQVVVGHNLWLIRLIQVILGALCCALIFLVGRNFFSRNTGIASGLILACYAPGIFFDSLIEKTILDLFLLSFLLLLLSRSIELQLWSRYLVSGAVVGLLGLSRENALILIFIVPLWITLYFSSASQSDRVRWVGFFFLGALIVLTPVGLRNLTVGGELTLTTSQFGPNFFIGNNPAADGTYGSIRKVIAEPQLEGNDAKRLAERLSGRSLSPGEISTYWFQQSWSYIRSQPREWLTLLASKWWLVWNAREIEDSDDFYIYQQWSWLLSFLASINHFGILAPLAAAGLWFTRNQWRRLWLLYAMILSLALSVAVFYVFGRYRFPLVPLLALFAGAALAEFLNLYKKRAWPALVAALGILLVSAVIVNWPIYSSGPGAAGYNNLSNAFYKQGRVDEAITTALKAIRLQPDYGVAYYNLGNLYAFQGRFELAKQHFEEALKLLPNYADAHSNLGQLLAEQGDIDAGIRHFRKAIALNPALSRAHLNLGVSLAKNARIEEAVRPLQEAVRLVPQSAEAHYYLGSVYAAQSRYDQAVESFNRALSLKGDFAAAHESLAQVLSLQGKKQEAVRHYREALRLMKGAKGTNVR